MLQRLSAMMMVLLLSAAAMARGAPAQKKPVLIFLLSGQSNMTGRGNLGDLNAPAADQQATLVRYIKAPQNVEKYKTLYDGPNKTSSGWTIRDDVFISYGENHGGLGPYYGGFRNKGFGPELGIGFVLGEHYDQKILLAKISFGGNNLAVDFRPPSSGGQVGPRYEQTVKAVKEALEHLPDLVPGYDKSQGYKLAGFFWNQGEHDSNDKFAPQYQTNLTNLITDLRKDLNAPDMKTVIAVTGCYGWDLGEVVKGIRGEKTPEAIAAAKKPWNMVRDAQLAVAKLPQFKGNVTTVETRDFWRPADKFGARGMSIHWYGNGESYWLLGEAMGNAMVKLLDEKP